MLRTTVDHLVIVAPSREAGVAYVSEALGVSPQPGGEHPRMGTHNALVRLGESMYLEVIAVNPAAPSPSRPRWFQLDAMDPPGLSRLLTWVARTTDIEAAVARSPVPLGDVEAMQRDALSWQITLTADGRPPLGGVAPSLIQWSSGIHPAEALPDCGCTLLSLELRHSKAHRVAALLEHIGFDGPVVVGAPSRGEPDHLLARIRTPGGIRTLGEP